MSSSRTGITGVVAKRVFGVPLIDDMSISLDLRRRTMIPRISAGNRPVCGSNYFGVLFSACFAVTASVEMKYFPHIAAAGNSVSKAFCSETARFNFSVAA